MTLAGTFGYCPQDPVLNDNLTVEQHLRYFAAAGLLPSLDRAGDLTVQLGYAQYRQPYQGFDWETYLSGGRLARRAAPGEESHDRR